MFTYLLLIHGMPAVLFAILVYRQGWPVDGFTDQGGRLLALAGCIALGILWPVLVWDVARARAIRLARYFESLQTK